MTTRRIVHSALIAVAVLGAPRASAQIISVPKPTELARPITLTASFGFLQSQARVDGQSGTLWYLGDALQWKALVDVGLRSGGLGLAVSVASVPIQRSGGTAPPNSDGTIQLRQYLATFRTRETQGPHQIIEVGLGLSQWAGYEGTDVLTSDERETRNAVTIVVGYGFGFSLGERAGIFVIQDLGTLWGSGEGLSANQSRQVQQYTTRIGLRYRVRGR